LVNIKSREGTQSDGGRWKEMNENEEEASFTKEGTTGSGSADVKEMDACLLLAISESDATKVREVIQNEWVNEP
jgi:hypothetical protein